MHQIIKTKNKEDLERCYPILKELRTNLSLEDFHSIYEFAHKQDGYELVALENDHKEVIAVMGYRFLFDYVHGKHLYIDDLVSTKDERSKGLGAQLLNYAEALARETQCSGLRLCTGVENELGKKFYEKNGWTLRAVVYKKKIK